MKLFLDNSTHFEDIKEQINEQVEVLEFKHTDKDLLKSDLKQLIDWENEKFKELSMDLEKKISTINVQFKSLSMELKVEVFKVILLSPELTNSNLLLNLLMLISSDTKYQEDEVYTNNAVIFGQPNANNGLEEFLDIKIEIKDEINAFLEELSKYYLSCLCSLHFKETDIAYDELQIMPVKYHQLITFLTFDDLSRLSRKTKNIKNIELVPVYNAKSILTSLILNQYPVISLLDSFQNLMRNPNE